jgi:hypothetical protein
LLCWQETSGKFGPRVSDEIQELSRMCPNVYICCSSSGKLTKSHVKNFITHVLKDNITNDFALILDSWSPQLNQDLYNQVFGPQNIEVQLFQIPPHCTPIVQPLDVFYFQQLKYMIKEITNFVLLHEINFVIHHRRSQIIIQSFAHNQLCAPIYNNMIKYAWFKSGYKNIDYEKFETIKDACFSNIYGKYCAAEQCCQNAFIKCSWCREYRCFKHCFIDDFHYHLCI